MKPASRKLLDQVRDALCLKHYSRWRLSSGESAPVAWYILASYSYPQGLGGSARSIAVASFCRAILHRAGAICLILGLFVTRQLAAEGADQAV